MKLTRKEVYDAIDSEREYQDSKWGGASHDSYKSVGDFLIYINEYLNHAKNIYTSTSGVDATLDVIRKITALGVAAMEYNGAPSRK